MCDYTCIKLYMNSNIVIEINLFHQYARALIVLVLIKTGV